MMSHSVLLQDQMGALMEIPQPASTVTLKPPKSTVQVSMHTRVPC